METFSSLLGAFGQVGALAAALFCAGLGALFLGNALYWRVHARGVSGRVVGVRQNGACFHTVYRYTSAEGQEVEATSKEGSSNLAGRATGAIVPLLVIRSRPAEVLEARNHAWTLLGFLLFAIGAWLFYLGITLWPVGPFTWLVGMALAGHILACLFRVVRAGEKRLGATGMRGMLAGGLTGPAEASPVQDANALLLQPAALAVAARRRAAGRAIAPVFAIVGILTLALAVHLGRTLLRMESAGIRVPGTVESLAYVRSNGHGGSYHAMVRFLLPDGSRRIFRDGFGSSPPSYHAGENVTVLVARDGSGDPILDRGIWNWIPTGIVVLFGVIFAFVSVRLWRNSATNAMKAARATY